MTSNKYIIRANDFLDLDGAELSDKMEELAADYISENEVDAEVDDLWNDGVAEEFRDRLQSSPDSDIYVDDYFQELIERMEK